MPRTRPAMQAAWLLSLVWLTCVRPVTAAGPLHQSALAQELPLRSVVHGELQAGASQTYVVKMNAGDLVSGTLDVERGVPLRFEVYDQAGAKLKVVQAESAGELRAGFVAPGAGTYRVRVVASAQSDASFTFRSTTQTVAQRMAGIRHESTVRYESTRIRTLHEDVRAGRKAALEQFWSDAARGRGPIVESIANDNQNRLVTFLWRETYETHTVEVIRAPFGPRDYRTMSRVPGTDVWYKTMKVDRSSRFSYWLAPNRRDEDGDLTDLLDPLNDRVYPDDADRATAYASVLDLPGAPTESWALRTPRRRGTVEARTFESALLMARLDFSIYTPSGYSASGGPYPLLVLLDGPAYATGAIAALTTLDNLIEENQIRPTVVCFLSSLTSAVRNRGANLQNPVFSTAIATELVPWLRSSLAISGEPKDAIIGGFSGGAGASAYTALTHPDTFGNALLQSGGPTLAAKARYLEKPRVAVRFYIDVGLYEPGMIALLPWDEVVANETNVGIARRFRDGLIAKDYEVTYRETGGEHNPLHWRATLAEALTALLPVRR